MEIVEVTYNSIQYPSCEELYILVIEYEINALKFLALINAEEE
jgi:hypothetical protein